MAKETDRIPGDIGCLDTKNLAATLISTTGNHCEVWQSAGVATEAFAGGSKDVVIKKHLRPCSLSEAMAYHREYHQLWTALQEIVPPSLYIPTMIDAVLNVIVVSEAVIPWFNLANPANEEESIPLLRQLPIARSQLQRFLIAARSWDERSCKVVDLYGIDNLILDRNRQVRYIDSFNVFFYEDILHCIGDVDEDLRHRISVSRARMEYLEYVYAESGN